MEIPVQTRVAKFFRSRKEGLEFFLLFLLVAAAFLVRIWGISKTHFWDEMVYLQNAQVICCGKINYSELDYRPPLLSLIYAGVYQREQRRTIVQFGVVNFAAADDLGILQVNHLIPEMGL